jgi:hypothetical protein
VASQNLRKHCLRGNYSFLGSLLARWRVDESAA